MLQRIRAFVQPGYGLLTWTLASLMALLVVTNVVESEWVEGFERMRIVALGGLIVAALFARWQALPSFLAHVFSFFMGLAWSIRFLPLDERLDSQVDRWTDMLIRGIAAIRAVKTGEQIEDYYLFSLAGLLLAWIFAYSTIWLLFRWNWNWRLVLLNGSLLMANLTYAIPKPIASFWLFLLMALLFLVTQTYAQRQNGWDAGLLEQQEWLSLRYLWAGVLACFSLVFMAALMPANITNAQLRIFGENLSRPIDFFLPDNGAERADRGPQGVGNVVVPNGSGASFSNNTVNLGGARSATNEVVLEVKAPSAEYWRSNAWDLYTGKGWQNTTGELAWQVRRTPTRREALTPINPEDTLTQLDTTGRVPFTQTIKLMQTRGDQQLPAATSPLTWSVPVLVQHSFIVSDTENTLPNFADSAIYFNQGPANEGFEYSVVSLISNVDKQSLRGAATDYPAWLQRYVQLPDSQSMRNIAGLSRQLTTAAGAETVYDKAVAIERYLREFPYDDQIPAPPADADPIENFLFNLRRGYCDYFAGSMVLMLRAQGIPARWVQGYATGDYDADRQVYVVRDTIAHSWPEVYFMGYGWIRFEPTPAGYVTVPIRPDGPPQAEDNSENPDDIGPNAGIVEPPTTNFDALQDLRENFQTTPIPTVEPQALPAEDVAAQVVESSPFWRWLAIICGVIGLIILLLWLLFQREFRGLRPAARAYGFIGLLARWAGLEQRPERTPQEFASDLAKEMPGQRRTLRRLADAYSAEQYGSQVRLDPEEIENDRAMVSRTLWPRSISRGWRSILQQILRPRWRR
ncbi:MAG: DUF3488 and transglutaminase-like domain-containing protein [Chloroflexi bacterium]|nr:DUF3488 and transglutaminase-like domain-containing protein [Chloroflexota bacterium]